MPWKLDDDFEATAGAIRDGARQVSRETAEKALKRAQAKAPVKTGKLRDSGRVVETEEGAKVVFEADYASQVEEGHFDTKGGKNGGGAYREGAHFLANGMKESADDMEAAGEKMLRDLGAN